MSWQAPPSWYHDPFGRYEHRFWDGSQWTDRVTSRWQETIDPPGASAPTSKTAPSIGRQEFGRSTPVVEKGSAQHEPALFGESVLVVSQKAKVFRSSVAYAVYDQHGERLGAVEEFGRTLAVRAVEQYKGRSDSRRTYRLSVVDADCRLLMTLIRPDVWVKSLMIVKDANGFPVGKIVQGAGGLIRGVRFSLESGEQQLGMIRADDAKGWGYNLQDANGADIARITKKWAGWAKERFTKTDNYVVEIHRPLEEPLRSLVLAASLAIDTALKQGTPSSKRRMLSKRLYE